VARDGKLREEVEKGKQVDALTKNPMFNEVFENLEEEFLTAWKMSKMQDNEERERIYYLYQSLLALKNAFANLSANGRLAQNQLDELVGRKNIYN
tara:strand:+ start:207 stop:491 length:285 start_codon:yes stop_codon:yes gene_type:complete